MDDFEARYKALKRRLKRYSEERIRLKTVRDEASQRLDSIMKECREAGLEFDGPDDLRDVLTRLVDESRQQIEEKMSEIERALEDVE